MPNTFQENLAENAYFQSLPVFVQETIRQSGISIKNEEELRECAQNLLKRPNQQ